MSVLRATRFFLSKNFNKINPLTGHQIVIRTESHGPKQPYEPQPGEFAFWGQVKPKADLHEVQRRVYNAVSSHRKIDVNSLQVNSHFVNDLGLDSLDHVELLMQVEDEFWVDLDTPLIDQLYSIETITKYLIDLHNNSDEIRRVPPLEYVPGKRPPKIVDDPIKGPMDTNPTN